MPTKRENLERRRFDPDNLILRPDHIDESKIERFEKKSRRGTDPPPIAVFKDKDGRQYCVDGTHRVITAKRQGKDVPGLLIEDDDYQIKGTNVVLLVIKMILRIL